jgi:hypothetical protein
MRSLNTTSLKSVSLISTAVLAAALAAGSNAALAASPPAHRSTTVAHVSHPRATTRVAARRPQFAQPGGVDVGQILQAMLGMVPPQYVGAVQNAIRRAASHRSSATSSGTYDPSWETPSYDTSTPIDNSASDAAAAAAQAAADSVAMSQSLAAAEEQNNEANAAFTQDMIDAQQTEINANN